jgi:hypothetical protein
MNEEDYSDGLHNFRINTHMGEVLGWRIAIDYFEEILIVWSLPSEKNEEAPSTLYQNPN